MTFDRARVLAEGGTYHGPDNPLIERAEFSASKVSFEPVSALGPAPAEIREDTNLPKRMMIEGVFQRADVRNANQRVYPRSLWERLLSPQSSVQKRVAEKAMIGHLEHPETGATDLNKGAIRIEKVWMESDGTVMGRAMVYNTPEGQYIQEYIATGTKIGISSRGTGTVDAKGVVCEDFGLETWDMVYNPSTPGAHPGIKNESADEQPVHSQRVVETSPAIGTIPSQESQIMNFAERIAAVRDQVSKLLAIDPKRLTVEQRTKHANDLLATRVAVAEEFSGEKRLAVEDVLKAIDEARKILEADITSGFGASSFGATKPADANPPVTSWAAPVSLALDKVADSDRAKAVADAGVIASLIAANLGHLPKIKSALEAALADKKPDDAPVAEAATGLSEEAKTLLTAARDELLTMTEREEAASAIIDEMTVQLAEASTKLAEQAATITSLQSEVTGLKAAADNAAAVIADLTSAKNAAKVSEAQEVAKPAAVPAAPAKKTLAERLSKPAPKTEGDEALPPAGKVVESTKDAGKVETKANLNESGNGSKGAALAASALAAMSRLTD